MPSKLLENWKTDVFPINVPACLWLEGSLTNSRKQHMFMLVKTSHVQLSEGKLFVLVVPFFLIHMHINVL